MDVNTSLCHIEVFHNKMQLDIAVKPFINVSAYYVIGYVTYVHIVGIRELSSNLLKPRLHDTTCCQTRCTTGCSIVLPVWEPAASCKQTSSRVNGVLQINRN